MTKAAANNRSASGTGLWKGVTRFAVSQNEMRPGLNYFQSGARPRVPASNLQRGRVSRSREWSGGVRGLPAEDLPAVVSIIGVSIFLQSPAGHYG